MTAANPQWDRLLIVGNGRMGTLIQAILCDRGHRIGATVGSRGDEHGRSLEQLLATESWDGAWEFTVPSVAPAVVAQLLDAGIPTLSGSTGWDVQPAIQLANSRRVPFLHSANFSIGIAIMRRLVQAASPWTRCHDFEPAIVERHHRFKNDQPSGTATLLAQAMTDSANVPIVSLRHGSVPGEHRVIFEGDAESIEITHHARSRHVFAHGAVVAGEWLLREQPNGFVGFNEFLERSWSWMSIGEESSLPS